MAHGKNQRLRFKRRRDGETDYRRRMKLLRGETPRAVVRISNTQTICQLVEFNPDGDIVIASVNGKALVDKYSWPEDASRKSIPASYLTGFALAKNAISSGHESAILDIGLSASSKGSRVFAALKGMIDAGLEIPHGEDVLPDEDRINGMHIDASMGDKVKKSIKAIEEA
ncbi:MAG: 50S ribosomal protein L18 [Candidatus Poseidoniales archaeon]|jgi:large subunit ribosomal protein L18|nr:50S ribosomal protein L18 [Euryarchaeota archaeon]|tara:strand:+ start:2249 stop:2758 length:510 start_codon:yes stop_codon:yes gene_type:complete